MTKRVLSLLLFCCFQGLMIGTFAQEKKWESEKAESRDNREADKLFSKAKKLWNDEQFAEAEKVYYQAHRLYPYHYWGLNELAEQKLEIGDIKGANKVWDDRIYGLRQPVKSYLIYQKDINQYIWQTYFNKVKKNLKKGIARTAILSTLEVLRNPPNDVVFATQSAMFGGPTSDSETGFVFGDLAEAAFLLNDKESLQAFQDLLPRFKSGNKAPLFYVDIFLKCVNGNYKEAIAIVENEMKNGNTFFLSKQISTTYLTLLYTYNGEYEKSEEFLSKRYRNPNYSSTKNIHGRNALGLKKPAEAVEYFTNALKPGKNNELIALFTTYTKRAEAYEALNDLQKARNDYEAALVYEPGYEPALNGLARLEGKIVSEQKTDKTPPEITITEPVVSRSIIVEADGEAMIKGLAKDQNGVKEVSINKQKAYLQKDGNFWAGVVLKEGLNTIVITASDFSGNIAEKTIELTRPPASKEVDIPALTKSEEKEPRNFVLLIGCQNYDDPNIPSLENPVPDAVKLKLILKNDYKFPEDNIFTLYNPAMAEFKQKFLELGEEIQPEDNLVIFYAGHGVWVKKEEKGYWLLTDAKYSDHETWLPNKTVLQMIANLKARHILLITDACFSGSVFRTRGLDPNQPDVVKKMNEKISRVAITSGNDTEVPDKSVFMKYLIKALSENKEKYLAAQKLFVSQILEAVMTETKTEPRYGTLELAGHVGGDFIFSKK